MSSDSVCPTFRKIFAASVFGVCVFLIPNGVQSATNNSATLQWAANQETDLVGYRVYHGTTSGNYGSPQTTGKTTSYEYTNLESNKTHYFSVTAFDNSGNESPPGLEVFKTVNASGGGGTPVTAWTAVGQNPGRNWTNSGYDNRSFRVLLEGAVIGASGSTVQLTLRGRTSGTYTMENISLVQRVGSTLNGVGPLTPLTFNGGATSVTVPAGGTVTSDPITFDLVAGQDVFLTFWVPSGAPGVYLTGGTQTTTWLINGTDQSGTIDWEGLTISDTWPNIYGIELVEVLAESGVPTITSQPNNVTVTEPATATFTVSAMEATGYQWRRNGFPITTGGTSASYTTPTTTTAQSGDTFDVVVSNSVGSVTSAPAILAILDKDSLLSISISGVGTVTSSPAGVSCSSGTCSGTFSQGSSVTLTSTPSSGSTFSGWSGGGCSGTGSCVVALSTSSVSVSANFASSPPPPSSLSVTLAGGGSGIVTGGVSCSSGTCSGTFSQGSSVTLTSTPSSGSTFSGWSGGGCSGTGSCVVALSTSSVSVSANFASSPPPPSSLSVTLAGGGSGIVTGGVSCSSGTCSGTFSQGSSVTLTSTPSSGSTFSGWSGGGCSGTGSCVVALSTSSVSVSANFASSPPPPSSLSVTLAGGGSGIVTGGVSCTSGTCSGTFSQGSSVTLTSTPSSGSTFAGWGGACTGTGSCVVALSTSSVSVSANFVSSPTVSRSLSVSLTGDGNGSVTSNPSGLICSGGICNASFPQGTTVTLIPTTPSGNVFQGWNGVCSGTSNCAVTLSSSQVVTATFALENSEPSLPKPNLPILVNFQPTASQVPTNFKKDDGSVFTSTRGYGWNKLLNGTEQNSTADQTLDTFVGASNQSPGTWNFTIPNGIYYVTMVLGDPKDAQGPHWVSVEGFQLAKQVNTAGGEYLAIVDYSVEVKDSTLSLTLGNSGQGQTILNYLAINEKPNLSNASQTLAQSFGTTLVASVLIPGEATKINPVVLVQKDQEEKDLQEKAMAQEKKQQEGIALALANEKKQREQEAVALKQAQAKQQAVALKQAQAKQQAVALRQAQAKQQAVALRQAQAKQQAVALRQAQAKQQAVALRQAQAKQQKEKEVVKLNKIKDKMLSIRKSGGTVSLRNLFGGP